MIPQLKLSVDLLDREFQVESAGLHAILRGPVQQDLVRRAIRIQNSAKEHATHRPGPMVRSGRLRGSITWQLGTDQDAPYVLVGTNVFYAPFLEYGTSRMPAYPFLGPALAAARIT